jgi:hypothetical protein
MSVAKRKSNQKHTRLYAILRSYELLNALPLINQLNATHMINYITVVINSEEDHIDATRLLKPFDFSTPIFTVFLERFGWSKALNAGIRSLPTSANEQEFVLMVSNEVKIIPQELNLLIKAASLDNSSCGYALFKDRTEPTYRLPRNTFCIWKRKIFEEIGFFDESLDGDTGMEDYDMVLRAFKSSKLLPFIGPKNVRIELPPDLNLAEKLEWENRGVEIIERRYPDTVVREVRKHIEYQNEGGK